MTESSLREYDRPADRIRLHRQSSENSILVTEGPSDQRLCERVFHSYRIDYFPVGSRNSVLEVAFEHSSLDIKNICYLVDRDFDEEVESAERVNPTVVPYDNGDLEAMLIESKTLDALLKEYASETKLANYGGPEAVRTHLISQVSIVASLRAANAAYSWGISFDDVDISDRYKEGVIKSQPLIDALLTASPESAATKANLVESAANPAPICPTTQRTLFRGRDAIALLPSMLKKAIATRKDKLGADALESTLRLAASPELLSDTSWFQRVIAIVGQHGVDSYA